MKKFGLICLLIAATHSLLAQQKDFEGTITYTVETKSNMPGISDQIWKTMLGLGDKLEIVIKKGNILRTTVYGNEYYIPQKQRVYLKFNKIDTLYYLDYDSDTTQVINVEKKTEQKTIAGTDCKAIVITTSRGNTKYFYAPSLYLNPGYNKDNKIGRYDVFARETGSIWLGYTEENKVYTLNHQCTSIKQAPVDDAVFNLPALPEKKFTYEAISVPARFSGSGGWNKYLQNNLKGDLAVKYLKIPRDQNTATQEVIVDFLVDEQGQVSNASVRNKKEVHAKLAEEAIRIVVESPRWKPATVFGVKVPQRMTQPVVFQVMK
ncbi:MAG: energy transducer TonB [Niastella sp.]|nr:energy transducer TonB [Niastella sp.]